MNTTMPSSSTLQLAARDRQTAWRTALPALLLVLATVLTLYGKTGSEMVAIWIRSDTFSHAFLVPPIVLWLLWRQRERLAAIAPCADAWMLVPAAGAALLWLLGELAAVNAITQLAFMALLVLSVPAVLGPRVAREAAFPLAFLFFAVPLGDFLLPWLMRMTADFTVFALRLSGVPVFRDGLLFVIPTGNWSVVEACSGVRYLIASFMVGTLYAYLIYRSTRRRLVFMAIALVLPLLANWVRAYLIVMLGHLSDNRVATGVDHLIYGWLFFGFVIFLLFQVGLRWAEPRALSTVVTPAGQRESSDGVRGRSWAIALVAAGMALLAAVPLSAYREIVQHESAIVPTLVAPETLHAGWHASAPISTDWRPKLANPSSEVDAAYTHEALSSVGLYMAYFRGQDESRKLRDSDSQRDQTEDRRWVRVTEGRTSVQVGSQIVGVQTATWRNRDEMDAGVEPGMSAWQLYWAGGELTDRAAIAKARSAVDRLLGRGDDSAEIILYTRGPTPEASDQTLQVFLRDNLGLLEAQLAQVRSAR